MITGFFGSEIRRLNRNLRRLGLLLLGLALAWTFALERDFCQRLLPPRPLDGDALLEAAASHRIPPRRWRLSEEAISSIEPFPPPGTGREEDRGRELATLGSLALLVRGGPGKIGPETSGILRRLPAEQYRRLIALAAAAGAPPLAPVALEAADPLRWSAVPAIPGILTAAALFCLIRSLGRTARPASHPLVRKLVTADPDSRLREIETALDQGITMRTPIRFGIPGIGNWSTTGRYRHHSVIRIGPGWFYYGCTLQAHLHPLDDLVWLFRQDRKMSTHGVDVGTAHLLTLRFRDGSELLVSLGETPTELAARIGSLVKHLPNAGPFLGLGEGGRTDVLHAIHQLAPWALVGHDPSLARAWGNVRSRQELVALVERRKFSGR